MREFQYILKNTDEGSEIKDLLKRHFDFSSRLRARIKRDKLVFLNGESVPGWISGKSGDVLSVRIPSETSNFLPEPIPISVLYEDKDILVINKQQGYICHPTKGHPIHTIANGIMKYMIDTEQEFKIRFVNRLDMDTSGILVIAKNSYSQSDFMKQASTIEKKYLAVVNGSVEDERGTIDLPIGRPDPDRVERAVLSLSSGGLPSVTHYKVLERFTVKTVSGERRNYTMLDLLLETGRTHQIRVHMSHMGHPVTGDHLYGGENINLIDRQALHAYQLSFNHPVTKERIQLEAPIPDDISCLVEKLRGK